MKRYIIVAGVLLFALIFTSCEDFLDVNTDPNNPTEVTPDLILPVAQTYTARYNVGNRRTNMLGNMMMYNWSETFGFSWYDDEFNYQVTTTFYSRLFDEAYTNALKQYTALDGLDDKYTNYKAISQIMKCFHFQILVDLYGDVPYSEALKRGGNATPKYDKAEDIYKDLMNKLDTAILMINNAAVDANSVVPGDDDVIFNGNMTKWKQFANTLKVRLLNRAKNTFNVDAELTKIANEGSGYISTDVAVQPGYMNEEGKQNPYWADLGWDVGGTVRLSNDATCATQYVLDYLANSNDPRIDYIYEKPKTGHLGVEQGEEASEDQSADKVSNIGPGILKGSDDHENPDLETGSGMPAIIFTLAESKFNLAELAQAGYNVGTDAAVLYYAGIQASFDCLGAGSSSGYASQQIQNISYEASAGHELEAIITQKWIALNGLDAVQSWFDYSRTGFPADLPVSAQASTSDRPVRLFYPVSEKTGNSVNVPEQPDAFTDKIFWAK